MIRAPLFFVIGSLCATLSFSQLLPRNQFKIDSLQEELYRNRDPTVKVNILKKLATFHEHDSTNYFRFLREALSIAEKNELKEEMVNVNDLIGWKYFDYAGFQAKVYILEALRISEEIDYTLGLAYGHEGLAVYYEDSGAYDLSISHYEQSIQAARASADYYLLAGLYNNIAVAHHKYGNYPAAIKNHLQSLELRKEFRKAGISRSLLNIGNIYLELEWYQKAEEALIDAYELMVDSEDDLEKATLYRCLGAVFLNKEAADPLKAMEFASHALAIFKNYDLAEGMAEANTLLGDIYFQKQSFDSAAMYYRTTVNILRGKNLLRRQVGLSLSYAKYLIAMDSTDKARALLEEGLSISKMRKMLSIESRMLHGLYDLEKRLGNYEIALHYYEALDRLKDSLSNAGLQRDIDLIKLQIQPSSLETDENKTERILEGYFLYVLLIPVLAITLFFVRRFRNSKKSMKHD